MAQTEERARSSNGSAAPTKQNAGASATDGAPKRRFDFSRLLMPRLAQPGPDGKPAPRERSPMSKFLFGWLILFVVTQVLLYGVQIAAYALHINLNVPIIGRSDVTFLSGITYLVAIMAVVVIGLYYILIRLNILPRNLVSSTSTQTTSRTGGTTHAAPLPPGQTRTRAARREAARTAAAAPPPSGKTRKVAAKPQPQPEPTRKPPARAAGAHDEVYERVKAQQRQQRRREAKH
jgi:hypothetical protein